LSLEKGYTRVPTLFKEAEGNIIGIENGEKPANPAWSETCSTHGHSSRGNREVPSTPATDGRTGRAGKVTSRNPVMNVGGKSDECVVPRNQPNKDELKRLSAEAVEGRHSTEGNTQGTTACRTQSRESASNGLWRVREVAQRDKNARFTNLLKHVTVDLLRESYHTLKKQAVPGMDGVTWRQYGGQAETRLRELHESVHKGTYRAQPSKRTYIPKADGKQRPLGIASLEDKIVQQAVVTVLSAISEVSLITSIMNGC
jgi:hypothetical protein